MTETLTSSSSFTQVTSTTSNYISPTGTPNPSLTLSISRDVFGHRLIIAGIVAIVEFATFTLGAKIIRILTKKPSLFWITIFFNWILLVGYAGLIWGLNYYILIGLLGVQDPSNFTYQNLLVSWYALFYAAYGFLSSVRIYRSYVTYQGADTMRGIFRIAFYCHIGIAVSIVIVQTVLPLLAVMNSMPSLRTAASLISQISAFYYRIICLVCDIAFVNKLRTTSMNLKESESRDNSINYILGTLRDLFYIIIPTATNIAWFVMVSNRSLNVLGTYLGAITVHVEMISFFQYSNRIMEQAFESKFTTRGKSREVSLKVSSNASKQMIQ